MTLQELAKALRDQQLSRSKELSEITGTDESFFRSCVLAVSDAEVINSYITCFCCGEELLSRDALGGIIAQSKDADDFFENLDLLGCPKQKGELELN